MPLLPLSNNRLGHNESEHAWEISQLLYSDDLIYFCLHLFCWEHYIQGKHARTNTLMPNLIYFEQQNKKNTKLADFETKLVGPVFCSCERGFLLFLFLLQFLFLFASIHLGELDIRGKKGEKYFYFHISVCFNPRQTFVSCRVYL